MLVIRQSQMEVFARASTDGYVETLSEHFRQCLPEHFAALGADGTREAIHYGIGRARTHGLTTDRNVTIYVRLMFLFGRDYDTDTRLPWVGAALHHSGSASEHVRIERLAQAAHAYLQQVAAEELE